jgi:hypothetical protein
MKKNLFIALALTGLAFGCKSNEGTETSVSTNPEACKTECADMKAECADMKAECAEKKAECSEKKVCPVTGKEIN